MIVTTIAASGAPLRLAGFQLQAREPQYATNPAEEHFSRSGVSATALANPDHRDETDRNNYGG
jgi:hypothetical protein